MTFFFSDNPIALFLALVLVVAILRIVLGRHKWFQGDNAPYIKLVLILVMVLLIAYKPLLSMISFGVPFFVLLVMFLFAIGTIFFVLGMPKEQVWPALKESAILRTAILVTIICIVAFAASTVFGEKLLEDQSVSIMDAASPAQESVEIDFAPIFTKQAIGLIMMIAILGLAFFFVNTAT